MLSKKILEPARILNQFACTMETMIVVAKDKAGLMVADSYRPKAVERRTLDRDQHRDMAMAYVHLARTNR